MSADGIQDYFLLKADCERVMTRLKAQARYLRIPPYSFYTPCPYDEDGVILTARDKRSQDALSDALNHKGQEINYAAFPALLHRRAKEDS